jgi:hypothetical protein
MLHTKMATARKNFCVADASTSLTSRNHCRLCAKSSDRRVNELQCESDYSSATDELTNLQQCDRAIHFHHTDSDVV